MNPKFLQNLKSKSSPKSQKSVGKQLTNKSTGFEYKSLGSASMELLAILQNCSRRTYRTFILVVVTLVSIFQFQDHAKQQCAHDHVKICE